MQCFVGACYSGDIGERLDKGNFRDVNKMAHVFEVTWLASRCEEFFKKTTAELRYENYDYEEILYIFEEAMFMLTAIKKKDFVDVILENSLSQMTYSMFFVPRYLTDLAQCGKAHLDIIIEMCQEWNNVLITSLINHLKCKPELEMDENTRHVIKRINIKKCFENHRPLMNELFAIMEKIKNPSSEDFALILEILKLSSQTLAVVKQDFTPIPNLFLEFSMLVKYQNLDQIYSEFITSRWANIFILFDAVYSWIFDFFPPNEKESSDQLFQKIENIFLKLKQWHTWTPIPHDYLQKIVDIGEEGSGRTLKMTQMLLKNTELVTTDSKKYDRLSSTVDFRVEDFFEQGRDIYFVYDNKRSNCYRRGKCGVVARVTPAPTYSEQSFDIKLVINSDLYPNNIHLHEELVIGQTCHFTFDIINQGDTDRCHDGVISWCGKPFRDRSKRYWCWGTHKFFMEKDKIILDKNKFLWSVFWNCGRDARIRPVIYFSYS